MLSELLSYAHVGFAHIISRDAADHLLFLLVLAAIYRPRDWRQLLWVITAFTVGHSITLMLTVSGWLALAPAVVELLIPLTIVATAVENLWHRHTLAKGTAVRYRPFIAVLFGLVHGAGFAGYLRSLFLEEIALPLLGFNVGIEIGQIVALLAIGLVLITVDALLTRAMTAFTLVRDAFLVRLTTVSGAVLAVALVWSWERLP